ncbi:hypothetical protein GCM10027601_21560 [Nocardioides ungokensis]
MLTGTPGFAVTTAQAAGTTPVTAAPSTSQTTSTTAGRRHCQRHHHRCGAGTTIAGVTTADVARSCPAWDAGLEPFAYPKRHQAWCATNGANVHTPHVRAVVARTNLVLCA